MNITKDEWPKVQQSSTHLTINHMWGAMLQAFHELHSKPKTIPELKIAMQCSRSGSQTKEKNQISMLAFIKRSVITCYASACLESIWSAINVATYCCSLCLPWQRHSRLVCWWVIKQIFNERINIAGRLQCKRLDLVLQQKAVPKYAHTNYSKYTDSTATKPTP